MGFTGIYVTVEPSDGTYAGTYTTWIFRASTDTFGWNTVKDFKLHANNDAPHGIWSDGAILWVVDSWNRKLYAYDIDTGAHIPSRDIDSGAPFPTGTWSDGETIWVSNLFASSQYPIRLVRRYSLATGQVGSGPSLGPLVGAPGTNPRGVWSDGVTMWVLDPDDNKVYAYNLADCSRDADKDIGTLGAAGNSEARGLWSNGETMWVADIWDDKIYAYDLYSGDRKLDLEFDTLGAAGNVQPMGLWSDGETMWVSDLTYRKIYAYNMPASALLESLEFDDVDIGTFLPGRFEYQSEEAASTVTQTTVTALAALSSSTVAITPADDDAGTTGHQVDLVSGDNTIAVTVTNGDVSRTYSVTVTVAAPATSEANAEDPETPEPDISEPDFLVSGDAVLVSLELSDIELDAFDPIVTDYNRRCGRLGGADDGVGRGWSGGIDSGHRAWRCRRCGDGPPSRPEPRRQHDHHHGHLTRRH